MLEKPRSLSCRQCGHVPDPPEFLSRLYGYFARVPVLFHRCRHCECREELQIADGAVLFGYVYAAGTAHFAAMERCELPALQVAAHRDGLQLRWADGPWMVVPETLADP
jgi:hypothetical protein